MKNIRNYAAYKIFLNFSIYNKFRVCTYISLVIKLLTLIINSSEIIEFY